MSYGHNAGPSESVHILTWDVVPWVGMPSFTVLFLLYVFWHVFCWLLLSTPAAMAEW